MKGKASTQSHSARISYLHCNSSPFSAMMQETGLGLRHCSEIMRGLKVPHAMYWQPLIAITAHSR